MFNPENSARIAYATREINASAAAVFELIADPSSQPDWDGNGNLEAAATGQRVRSVGTIFTMRLTNGQNRENHVVEFEEGRRIAWLPAVPGEQPPGHLWRWELEPRGSARTLVTHTYDWTRLTDPSRVTRARDTTSGALEASLRKLAICAEGDGNE